ncbi:MAG: NF038104 family lipoprotein [Acinetobacter sp.]
MIKVLAVIACMLLLQGCITKIVTVPVKIAYKTTKGVVKGTAAVVGAVIPDGDDEDGEPDAKKNKDQN